MFKNDRLFLLVLKTMMLLISCIALGTILLLLVYSIPVVQIDRNVRASAVTLEKEGAFPSLTKWCTSQLDNWTDSTMLLNAAYDGEETVLEQALMVYKKRIEGLNPQQSIVEYYLRGGGANLSEFLRKILAWIFGIFEATTVFYGVSPYQNCKFDYTNND